MVIKTYIKILDETPVCARKHNSGWNMMREDSQIF